MEDKVKRYKQAFEICKEFIEQCIDEGTVSAGYATDILEEAQDCLEVQND